LGKIGRVASGSSHPSKNKAARNSLSYRAMIMVEPCWPPESQRRRRSQSGGSGGSL